MSQSIFPTDNAEGFFRSLCPDVERQGNRMRWPSADGTTEFNVETIEQRTYDGLVVRELVTLTHSSPDLEILINAGLASHANKWATMPFFAH